MPHTSIGVNEHFWHKWHHLSCDMTSSIISSLSVLNIWWCRGLTALLLGKWGLKITCPARKSTRPILMEWTFFNPWWPWQCAGFYMYLTNDEYKFEPITRKCQEKNFLINLIVYTNIHYSSTMILYLLVHLLTNVP